MIHNFHQNTLCTKQLLFEKNQKHLLFFENLSGFMFQFLYSSPKSGLFTYFKTSYFDR